MNKINKYCNENKKNIKNKWIVSTNVRKRYTSQMEEQKDKADVSKYMAEKLCETMEE